MVKDQYMLYHKCITLVHILNGDLNSKLTKWGRSLDIKKLNCNWNSKSKTNGNSIHDGKYRHYIVFYKATGKIRDMFYTSKAQQQQKGKMTMN